MSATSSHHDAPPPSHSNFVARRVVIAFVALALLSVTGYAITVRTALAGRGLVTYGESLARLRIRSLRAMVAEARSLNATDASSRNEAESLLRLALRESDSIRANLEANALSDAESRAALQQLLASERAMRHAAIEGLARLDAGDTAAARARFAASAEAQHEIDRGLDDAFRALGRIVVTGQRDVAWRLGAILALTLGALLLFAFRSVLPAVRELAATNRALQRSQRQLEAQQAQLEAEFAAREAARAAFDADAAKLRAAEQRAIAELESFAAVVRQTKVPVIMTDARVRTTYVNPAWEKMTGWTLAEVVGRKPGDLVQGPETDPATRVSMRAAINAGRPFSGEILNVRKDGTPYWLSINTTPVRNAAGELQGFVAIERDVTTERAEEDELRAERAFARSLLEANPEGITSLDHEHRVLEWNPALERLTGIPRAEALGQTIDQVIPVEHPELRRARLDQLFVDGRSIFEARTQYLPRTGERRVLEVVGTAVRDPLTGKVVASLGNVRDVTERQAAEERFRMLFESSSEAHLLYDETGILDCNAATLQLLGAESKAALIGQHPAVLSPALQPDGARSSEKGFAMEAIALANGHHRFDWVHQRMDGRDLLVEVSLTSVKLSGRAALLVVWHDLTERKAAEDAVRRERERLSDAVEALESGFAMFDAEQRLIAYNRGFLGVAPPGAPPPPIGITLRQLLEGSLENGRHRITGEPGELWISRALARHDGDGGVFEERLGGQAMRMSVSRTRDGGSVVLNTDISSLKAIQQSLEEARDAATEANHAKSAFLASMSHELRTPLNSIIGFTRQVRRNRFGTLAATEMNYLERVERSGVQLLSLINDLLDLSKIEAGKLEARPAPIDLNLLVTETVAQLEGQPRKAGVRLECLVPARATPFETDGDKVRQVLINLVGNALKFTHAGSVTVRLDADDAGYPRAIEVIDTGIGIAGDRLGAIFRAFEQAERTIARDYGGTGLGLTISRSLCDLLGLTLEVASTVGVGTTFRIVFPPLEHGAALRRTPIAVGAGS